MSLAIFIIVFISVNIKACPDHCEICNEENICTSCKNGYYLISGYCEDCSSNCKTCETTLNNCLSCKTGYYLNSSKCENALIFVKDVLMKINVLHALIIII